MGQNKFSSLLYKCLPFFRYRVLTLSVGALQANCYIVIDRQTDHCAVVDPGGDADRLLSVLRENNLHLDCILLTHAHADHFEALPALIKATGAPLALHEADAELLADNTKNCTPPDRFDAIMPPPDVLLHDEDEIMVGEGTVRVIHTPGHSPGSVCYLAGNHLLSGDTLFRGACGRTDLYGGSMEQMKQSLRIICGLGGHYRAHPGHGESSHLMRELSHNIYLQHL